LEASVKEKYAAAGNRFRKPLLATDVANALLNG